MNWSNLAIWNAQIALLVVAAAALTAAFRLRPAAVRLLYWQVLLAVCLALPAIQPWHRDIVMVSPAEVAVDADAVPGPVLPSAPAPRRFSWPEAALWVLAAGVLCRAGRFGLGLVRLTRYRRVARPLDPLPAPVNRVRRELGVYPEMALSDEVSSPVTFGVRDPVVLFPAHFVDLDPEVQSAVACHELLHVRRRDWLFTAIEEMVRAVFWFHPAIWWVLGQIQLAREQSVDREVVHLAVARERYVDALLAFSGVRRQLDLAPAPLFLRRRHLTARVAAIIKEAEMSHRRLLYSMAACVGVLLAAGWLVCGSLPLKGAPQLALDAPGITVSGGERLLHRAPIEYPADARAKGIEGTVLLDVLLAPDGTVADAAAIGGPAELRQAALSSVRAWHYSREAAPRQQVSVEFKRSASPGRGVVGGVPGGVVGGVPGGGAPPQAATARPELRTPEVLARLSIQGISQAAAGDLRKRLRLEEGRTVVDQEALERLRRIVRDFDGHLTMSPAWVTIKPGGEYGTSGPRGSAPPGAGLALIVYPASGGTVNADRAPRPDEASSLAGVPRKLVRVDIQGLSPEAAAELRRRLAVQNGQPIDSAGLQRIDEIVREFDPHLGVNLIGTAPRRAGADGKVIPPDAINMIVRIVAPGAEPAAQSILSDVPRRLTRVDIEGLSPDATAELRRQLAIREGGTLDYNEFVKESQRIGEVVKAFDPHLRIALGAKAERRTGPDGSVIPPERLDMTFRIQPADAAPQSAAVQFPPAAHGVPRVRVGGNVQQAKLIHSVRPSYPPEARQARIQGTVQFEVLIDTEGSVKAIRAISGHPLLLPAAAAAVKENRYTVTLLNGQPAEVATRVAINFTISE